MSRKKIVAGNWKMNLSSAEALTLAGGIKNELKNQSCDVIIIPSYLYLGEVRGAISGSAIRIGAQNCSERENGAFTGEVSAAQLKSADIEFVIIGHSERREYYDETNAILKSKLAVALKHGLKPIFCFGEPLPVREAKKEHEYVTRQLEESLFPISEREVSHIVLAYEPIWAIGTGLNASAPQVQEMHTFVRSLLKQKYSATTAQTTRILYGGSVKPANAKELFGCPDVDGGLIGGASLVAKDFLSIIESAG